MSFKKINYQRFFDDIEKLVVEIDASACIPELLPVSSR